MKSTSVHSLRCCVMWMFAHSVDRGSARRSMRYTAPRGGCARRDRPRRLRFASLCVTYTAVIYIYIYICVSSLLDLTPPPLYRPATECACAVRALGVAACTLSDDSVHSTQTRPPRLPSRASPQDSLYATIRPRAVHSNTERFHDRPIGSVKRQLASNVAHGRGAVEAKAAALDLARLRLALQ